MHRKATILFVLAIILDGGSMTANEFLKQIYNINGIPFWFLQELRNIVYFTGQSTSRLFYIWTILVLTKDYLTLNILSIIWFGCACNDTFEELFADNTKFDWTEYLAFFISIPLVAWKIYKHKINKPRIGDGEARAIYGNQTN